MKTTLKLGLVIMAIVFSSTSIKAQEGKKYKIVMETIENGKQVSIDTSFTDKAEMENYLKATGHSIPKIASIPVTPNAPEIPDLDEMIISLDGTDLSAEQKAEIEKELKKAKEEMRRANIELKKNEEELKQVQEELENVWIEVDENNENGEKVIIQKIKSGGEGSSPKIIFIKKDDISGNDGDVKIIHLSGEGSDENHQIKIIRKSETNDENDHELIWNTNISNEAELAIITEPISKDQNANKVNEAVSTADYRLPVNDFKLYPNPTKDKVTVSFNLETPGPVEFRLLDASGKLVADARINSSGGYINQEFNIEGNARGTYLLQIKQGEKWRHEKVVLK